MENMQRAVDLNPNGADNVMFHAAVLNRIGDPNGLEISQKALRLNPNPPVWYLSISGGANWLAGRHEEAIATLTRCTNQLSDYIYCRVKLILALVDTGREEDVRVQVNKLLRIDPRFSSVNFAVASSFTRLKALSIGCAESRSTLSRNALTRFDRVLMLSPRRTRRPCCVRCRR